MDVLAFGGHNRTAGADDRADNRALQAAQKASDDRADTGAGPRRACFLTNATALEDLSRQCAHWMLAPADFDLIERKCKATLPVDPSRPLYVGDNAPHDGTCGHERPTALHHIDNRRRLEPLLD